MKKNVLKIVKLYINQSRSLVYGTKIIMLILNRYVIVGVLLFFLGLVLTPIIIGIPLIVIGLLVADFGVMVWFIKKIPGLENKIREIFDIIKESYKPYFRKAVKEK